MKAKLKQVLTYRKNGVFVSSVSSRGLQKSVMCLEVYHMYNFSTSKQKDRQKSSRAESPNKGFNLFLFFSLL